MGEPELIGGLGAGGGAGGARNQQGGGWWRRGGTERAGGSGGNGGRGLNGPSYAIANVSGLTPAFSATGAPTLTGFGCTLNSSPSCGAVPNAPYVFNVQLLEGCTNSEITISQTVGGSANWVTPGAERIDSAGGNSVLVVSYPSQGWYTVTRDGPPAGAGGADVQYSEFINIFTDRLLPGIRTLYGGNPSKRMCAGEFMVFEHIPALGRFGDANTVEWQWSFPGGAINPSGAPVPPSVRASRPRRHLLLEPRHVCGYPAGPARLLRLV